MNEQNGTQSPRAAQAVTLLSIRELLVTDPAALTVEVLQAAGELTRVVLQGGARLPDEMYSELARRQILVTWLAHTPTGFRPVEDHYCPPAADQPSLARFQPGSCTF
jgi:hypothetical protein